MPTVVPQARTADRLNGNLSKTRKPNQHRNVLRPGILSGPAAKDQTGVCDERHHVDATVAPILQTAATVKIGDGKIFLTKVHEAIRMRDQERSEAAL